MYGFEGARIFTFFISFSSLLASLQIIRSKKNTLWPSLNNIHIPLTILFSIFICILFIEFIKGSFDTSFLLKLIQVIAFIIPSFYVGSRLIFDKNLNVIMDILMILTVLQFMFIYVPAIEESGCLFCLANYVYGMRLTEGFNLMGNSILALSVLNLIIIKALKLLPILGLVNSYYKHSILLRKCFVYSLIYTCIVIVIPSRQLFIGYFLAIIIFFSSEIKLFIFKIFNIIIGRNKKINLFIISNFLASFSLLIFLLFQIYSTIILRFEKNLLQAGNFIRLQQIDTGLQIFYKNPFLGSKNDLILKTLSKIDTTVFENSYVDLLAKTGAVPLILILFLLFYFVKNSYSYKFNLNSRLIIVLIVAALFNEIIIEPVFWVPIFITYGFEKSIIFTSKAD